MSEKIFSCLLRLYPGYFRRQYGRDAMQLFRDRARDERGPLGQLRLWLDVLSDLALFPLQFSNTQPAMSGAPSPQQFDGVPGFYSINDDLPRPGVFLSAAVVSLILLISIPLTIGSGRRFSESAQWGGGSQPKSGSGSATGRMARAAARAQAAAQAAAQAKDLNGAPAKLGDARDAANAKSLPPGDPKAAAQELQDDNAGATTGSLSAAERQRIVNATIANLQAYYVDPDKAQKVTKALLAHEMNGDDDKPMDGVAFAALLTKQMQEASNDGNLMLAFTNGTPDHANGVPTTMSGPVGDGSQGTGGHPGPGGTGHGPGTIGTGKPREGLPSIGGRRPGQGDSETSSNEPDTGGRPAQSKAATALGGARPQPAQQAASPGSGNPRSASAGTQQRGNSEGGNSQGGGSDCKFDKVEVMPDNIGYLKLNSFPDPTKCQGAAELAMATLNRSEALIFDLRDNQGGSQNMINFLSTYLFDHPTHMVDFYSRADNSMKEYWTLTPIPGNQLADKPVYILTSNATLAGGEEFSYDLKMLKRATLIGEKTKGAPPPTTFRKITEFFGIQVPEAKPINPVSKTNWENVGVMPDVSVKASVALDTAKKLAEGKVRQSAPAPKATKTQR